MNRAYSVMAASGNNLKKHGVEFYDLSGIFKYNTQDIYGDRCHFMLKGNRIIAQGIFKIIEPYLKKSGLLKG